MFYHIYVDNIAFYSARDFWDYFSIASTALVASATFFVGYKQWKVSKYQHNLDLFNKR